MRKKAGFKKSDKIELYVKCGEELAHKLSYHETQIKEKVGASEIKVSKVMPKHNFRHTKKEKVRGQEFEIMFNKA